MGIIDGIKKLEQGITKLVSKIKGAIQFFMSSIRNGSWFNYISVSGSSSSFGFGKDFGTCTR